MSELSELKKQRGQLMNQMTKLEAGKSSMRVGDARQMGKLLVALETELILKQKPSVILTLRKEALANAQALKLKRKKQRSKLMAKKKAAKKTTKRKASKKKSKK